MTAYVRKCPLCGGDAPYEFIGFPAPRRHFNCPRCGEFVVDSFGESKIGGYAEQLRTTFAEESRKTSGGYIYVITVERSRPDINVSGQAMRRSDVLR